MLVMHHAFLLLRLCLDIFFRQFGEQYLLFGALSLSQPGKAQKRASKEAMPGQLYFQHFLVVEYFLGVLDPKLFGQTQYISLFST